MKCLTNKWREGAMLLSFLLISSLAGIFTACDDIEDEYITDTPLSILQESRTSLNYLLKNSTYGTAPGTYPETGMSGDFANNRGKLPMPISGAYIITSHYGQYAVEGLRNVKLDNKGIDIQGKPGAQARAIFNGKVAAVFKLNGLFNILIRHGAYISVYCNLASASVKQGDTVTTKQAIGQVFSDGADGGRTVLHFQLRREKEKLNPEPWLNR